MHHLLPLLRAGQARVTTQVSIAADQGAINWDDLNWERSYDVMKAYRQSKIALAEQRLSSRLTSPEEAARVWATSGQLVGLG